MKRARARTLTHGGASPAKHGAVAISTLDGPQVPAGQGTRPGHPCAPPGRVSGAPGRTTLPPDRATIAIVLFRAPGPGGGGVALYGAPMDSPGSGRWCLVVRPYHAGRPRGDHDRPWPQTPRRAGSVEGRAGQRIADSTMGALSGRGRPPAGLEKSEAYRLVDLREAMSAFRQITSA